MTLPLAAAAAYFAYETFNFYKTVRNTPATVIETTVQGLASPLKVGQVAHEAMAQWARQRANSDILHTCIESMSDNADPDAILNLQSIEEVCLSTMKNAFPETAPAPVTDLVQSVSAQALEIMGHIPNALVQQGSILTPIKSLGISTIVGCQQLFAQSLERLPLHVAKAMVQTCTQNTIAHLQSIPQQTQAAVAAQTIVNMCVNSILSYDYCHQIEEENRLGGAAADALAIQKTSEYVDVTQLGTMAAIASMIAVAILAAGTGVAVTACYMRNKSQALIPTTQNEHVKIQDYVETDEDSTSAVEDHDVFEDIEEDDKFFDVEESTSKPESTPTPPLEVPIPKPAPLVTPSPAHLTPTPSDIPLPNPVTPVTPSLFTASSTTSETTPPATPKAPATPKKYTPEKYSLKSHNAKPAPKSSSSSNGWGSSIRRWFSSLRSCVRSFFSIFRF